MAIASEEFFISKIKQGLASTGQSLSAADEAYLRAPERQRLEFVQDWAPEACGRRHSPISTVQSA